MSLKPFKYSSHLSNVLMMIKFGIILLAYIMFSLIINLSLSNQSSKFNSKIREMIFNWTCPQSVIKHSQFLAYLLIITFQFILTLRNLDISFSSMNIMIILEIIFKQLQINNHMTECKRPSVFK